MKYSLSVVVLVSAMLFSNVSSAASKTASASARSKKQAKKKHGFRAPSEAAMNAVLQTQKADVPLTDARLADRVRAVSDAFRGAPYQASPLGEGAGQDPDPRLRFDAFDCTTFVETTMALSLAENVAEARQLLDVIRYQTPEVRFENRRHFPAAQWIPQLEALGFLKDITQEVAGAEVVVEKKVLNPAVWRSRKKPTVLELDDDFIPDGEFSLFVWPLDLARKNQAQIPPGTVLNLVRVNYKRIPVRVSHQGLIIEKAGKLFMRHAADRMYHSVVDEPLDHFFRRMQQYKKWPVRGIHLMKIQAPQNWRAMLKAKVQPLEEVTRH